MVLELDGVEKSYGSLKVLKGINLDIQEGEIFGLLGPNGAGKTTMFQTVIGLLKPDNGEILVEGEAHDRSKAVKRKIGYLPSDISFYEGMTGRQNLKFFSELADKDPDIDHLLETVSLEEHGDRKVGDYSTGMKKRLGIAQSLIKDPEIAIYDEPTTGLDPEGKKEFRKHVEKINKKKNITVVISSHITGEIAPLCSRFGILYNGKIQACGTKKELAQQTGTDQKTVIQVEKPGKAAETLEENSIEFEKSGKTFKLSEGREGLDKLTGKGLGVERFDFSSSSLESAYMSVIGREADK
ncbi:MAG: ABC transporter ATP-binding protein [Candidatus Nanohalobium sp.]